MYSIGTNGYKNTNFTQNLEINILWPNRIYMLGQWDEGWYQKGIQHCNQYKQNEDYHLRNHDNEEEVMRWNSNAFSLQKEWIWTPQCL